MQVSDKVFFQQTVLRWCTHLYSNIIIVKLCIQGDSTGMYTLFCFFEMMPLFKIWFSEFLNILKTTLHRYLFVVSFLQVCNTPHMYGHQITFCFVSLKVRVNRSITKLDGKNIICVLMLVLCYNSVFKWIMSILYWRSIIYSKLAKKLNYR